MQKHSNIKEKLIPFLFIFILLTGIFALAAIPTGAQELFEVKTPAASYFAATSGVFQEYGRLTAWSGNVQRLIGANGTQRTPVVFNHRSIPGGWRSAGSAVIDYGVTIDTASAFQIEFRTTGYENIRFSCAQKSTGSGPEAFRIAYSIGSPEEPFIDIAGSGMVAPKEAANNTYAALHPTYIDFTLPAEIENQDTVYLRVYLVNSTYDSISGRKNGNTSINDISIVGDSIIGDDNDVELMGLVYIAANAAADFERVSA